MYSGDRVILVDPGSRTVVQEREVGPLRGSSLPQSSAFQVELGAQSVRNRFDHVAPIRILRPIRHDHDFPGIFVGRDRDGQVRRPFADVFHLQPDGGFEFFARFRRLFQVSITGLRRDPGPPPSAIRAGPCLKSGREPLAIRYRHRPLTAGGGPSSQGWCGDNVPTEYRC